MIIICEGENRESQAEQVESPKHIWIDGDRIVVYTGEDIPNNNDE